MGVLESGPILQKAYNATKNLSDIRRTFSNVGRDPTAAIKALMAFDALDAAFMVPPVPVQSVAAEVDSIISTVKQAKFRPIVVLDGQRHPPKYLTNKKRYKRVPQELEALNELYKDPNATIKAIRKQQKKCVMVRPDVLYEVVRKAEDAGAVVICAPFEADHQLIALDRQGIADFVITDDSDLPFQGTRQTIMKLNSKGSCRLVKQTNLCRVLKEEFKTKDNVTLEDMAFFACLMGNDYCPRVKGHGVKTTLQRMVVMDGVLVPVHIYFLGYFCTQHNNNLKPFV